MPDFPALSQGDAQLDLRAGAAIGFDPEGAANVGRSLVHAEQAKAADPLAPDRAMIRIEAHAVVVYHHLNEAVLLSEEYGDMACARMLLDVSQCLLEDAVESQLDFGWHPGDQPRAGQPDQQPRSTRKFRSRGAEHGDQAQVIQ